MAVSSPNNQTVLITGINGYIASVLGLYLLEAGYTVRGTTRRLASAEPLLKGSYAPYFDRVKIYEVSDMTIPGAFDEAAKGSFHPFSLLPFRILPLTSTPPTQTNHILTPPKTSTESSTPHPPSTSASKPTRRWSPPPSPGPPPS